MSAPSTSPSISPSAAADARSGAGFVPEIQGLRTIALLLVASFHIWFGRVSGGVDIFLLISAYLLTRSLTTNAERGKFTRPITFILRKFARLLPAAVTAILLTLASGFLLIGPRHWESFAEQAFAAASYTMNFWLQGQQVDYYAQGRTDASIFQHFWSLAIQGQVFILWPFLHLAAEAAAKVTKIRVRWILIAGSSIGVVASFIYALNLTAVNQPYAYFSTPARLWEFALGSLVALVVVYLKLPGWLRHAMTWLGIAGAVSCGFVLPVQSSFPGWATLWPTISAALVLVAADAPRTDDYRGNAFLRHPWLQTAGEYSYALYLTHWPVLIIWSITTASSHPGFLRGTMLLGIATVAAVVITWISEKPAAKLLARDRKLMRERERWPLFVPQFGFRAIAVLTVCVLLAAASVVGSRTIYEHEKVVEAEQSKNVDVRHMGAEGPANASNFRPIPGELIATEQMGAGPQNKCSQDDPYWSDICFEEGDAATADRDILIVGSSHAVVYSGTVMETARNLTNGESWHVRLQGAPGCLFVDPGNTGNACADLWTTADRYIREQKPDAVLVVATQGQQEAPDYLHNVPGEDLVSWVKSVTAQGTQVIAMRDVPRFNDDMLECGAQKGWDNPDCIRSGSQESPELTQYQLDIEAAGGSWVDLTDVVCPDDMCRPAQGGLVTYFDYSHLTDAYARSLAQKTADQLAPLIGWWPDKVWAV